MVAVRSRKRPDQDRKLGSSGPRVVTSIVQYDEKFEEKVGAGARALLKDRASRGLLVNVTGSRDEARMVLLAAMTVDAGQVAAV
ncbi:hypothetical protein G6L37_06105 [Agrobacterium rubi]|nr:hypothetical protein [Agrobacterium rubi]NTF24934.1 hypothetical protein [Agrobacterium rubi]